MDLAIKAERLDKAYRLGAATVPVLQNINLEIPVGQQVAVVGPSGVGKSTLLHVLGALDRPTAGEVFILNQALSRLNSDALAQLRNRQVGFVFQFHHLLPEFTALENVLMPARLAGDGESAPAVERARLLLDQVGLSHRLHHRPGELSGGESQRVAVARAMMNRPAVIMADEPTGNLDGEAAAALQRILAALAREERTTLVVATHNPEFAASMDRVITLHQGHADESIPPVAIP